MQKKKKLPLEPIGMAGALRTPHRQTQDLQVFPVIQSRRTRNSSQRASTSLHWLLLLFSHSVVSDSLGTHGLQ